MLFNQFLALLLAHRSVQVRNGGLQELRGPVTLDKLYPPAAGFLFFLAVGVGCGLEKSEPLQPFDVMVGKGKSDIPSHAVADQHALLYTFGIQQGHKYHWNSWVLTSIVAGVLLFVVFVVWQARNRAEPLVPQRGRSTDCRPGDR